MDQIDAQEYYIHQKQHQSGGAEPDDPNPARAAPPPARPPPPARSLQQRQLDESKGNDDDNENDDIDPEIAALTQGVSEIYIDEDPPNQCPICKDTLMDPTNKALCALCRNELCRDCSKKAPEKCPYCRSASPRLIRRDAITPDSPVPAIYNLKELHKSYFYNELKPSRKNLFNRYLFENPPQFGETIADIFGRFNRSNYGRI